MFEIIVLPTFKSYPSGKVLLVNVLLGRKVQLNFEQLLFIMIITGYLPEKKKNRRKLQEISVHFPILEDVILVKVSSASSH